MVCCRARDQSLGRELLAVKPLNYKSLSQKARPKTSEALSTTTISRPSRITMEHIDPNTLDQAFDCAQIVHAMKNSGQAEDCDFREAERYRFETTAACCNEHGSKIMKSCMEDELVNPILKFLSDTCCKLKETIAEQNADDFQKHFQKLSNQIKDVKTELGDQIKDVKTELSNQIKDVKSEIKEVKVKIQNDRMRKKNQRGYSIFKSPVEHGEACIHPIVKEVSGQMNVERIKSPDAPAPVPFDRDPLIGETFESMPSTWDDVFSMTHGDILKICQWYNDDMGIIRSHSLAQRRLAVVAWLTGA